MKMTTTKEANGYAVWFSGDCYEAWQQSETACAYDACEVVFPTEEDADQFAQENDCDRLRPVYWVNGPQGFVLHKAE